MRGPLRRLAAVGFVEAVAFTVAALTLDTRAVLAALVVFSAVLVAVAQQALP